jgi:endo-1,4-beta-D-glucanase Y
MVSRWLRKTEIRQDAGKIGRREVLGGAALGAAGLSWSFAARADDSGVESEWQSFRSRFLTADGRVIDTGNGNISHSEGQGWGMLFAEAAGDQESFDLILAWTSTHLARPGDALHIWKYDPGAAHPTADTNNATDGDIFIAWALARAARRWAQPALTVAAAAIAGDILGKLIVQQSGTLFLLPGIDGFSSAKNFNLNPSYYVFPAFDTLAELAPSQKWNQLRADALDTLQSGLFGAWGLPPDWLSVSRPDLALALASGWPPRFGFDAIRVPLWLSWAKIMPAGMAANFVKYWQSPSFPYRPAWINLADGSFANFAAPSGMQAVADLTIAAAGQNTPQLPSVASAADYYSAALTLLSWMAAGELGVAQN